MFNTSKTEKLKGPYIPTWNEERNLLRKADPLEPLFNIVLVWCEFFLEIVAPELAWELLGVGGNLGYLRVSSLPGRP